MTAFDFEAFAELYPTPGRAARRKHVTYKRFDKAAEAVRYAVEEMKPDLLAGAVLEVEEERFDAAGIRGLYARSDYPLPRAAGFLEAAQEQGMQGMKR